MKKVLIFGASGLLGSRFFELLNLEQKYNVWGTYKSKLSINSHPNLVCLDILHSDRVTSIISDLKPDLVINCVGLTNIEYCESHKELALVTNVDFPTQLSRLSSEYNFKLLHFGSDNFKTIDNSVRDESCEPIAVNHYGVTKLLAEKQIQEYSNSSLIIRCNFFGLPQLKENGSILNWAMDCINQGIQIKGYINIFFNPLSISELIRYSLLSVTNSYAGIINFGADEQITKYEFLVKVQDFLKTKENLVKPSLYLKSDNLIDRPENMTLDISKFKKLFGINLPTISDMILQEISNTNRIK